MTNSEDMRACPHCARPFLVVPAAIGKTIRCRDCKQPFRIPATKPVPVSLWTFKPRLPKATQAFVDGTDVRRCPVCGRAFVMQESLSGKTIRCRGCRNMFVVEADHDACASHVQPRSPDLVRAPEAESENMAGRAVRTVYCEDIGDDLEGGVSGEQYPAAVQSPRQLAQDENPAGVAVSIAAVALGGLTALPVTLLILWWVLGLDPLHIASQLPEALRWLAPDRLAK